ncbi:MAG: hypothetical protein ACQEXV_12620 [Bacillota bacterium]
MKITPFYNQMIPFSTGTHTRKRAIPFTFLSLDDIVKLIVYVLIGGACQQQAPFALF